MGQQYLASLNVPGGFFLATISDTYIHTSRKISTWCNNCSQIEWFQLLMWYSCTQVLSISVKRSTGFMLFIRKKREKKGKVTKTVNIMRTYSYINIILCHLLPSPLDVYFFTAPSLHLCNYVGCNAVVKQSSPVLLPPHPSFPSFPLLVCSSGRRGRAAQNTVVWLPRVGSSKNVRPWFDDESQDKKNISISFPGRIQRDQFMLFMKTITKYLWTELRMLIDWHGSINQHCALMVVRCSAGWQWWCRWWYCLWPQYIHLHTLYRIQPTVSVGEGKEILF